MPSATATPAPRVPHKLGRTRVGNGTDVLAGKIDGRTIGARRFRELFAMLAADITKGQREPTVAETALARRAATISMFLETEETKMANGEAVEMNDYLTATNTLRRILENVGLVFPASVRVQL